MPVIFIIVFYIISIKLTDLFYQCQPKPVVYFSDRYFFGTARKVPSVSTKQRISCIFLFLVLLSLMVIFISFFSLLCTIALLMIFEMRISINVRLTVTIILSIMLLVIRGQSSTYATKNLLIFPEQCCLHFILSVSEIDYSQSWQVITMFCSFPQAICGICYVTQQ